jgi:putative membrane protein
VAIFGLHSFLTACAEIIARRVADDQVERNDQVASDPEATPPSIQERSTSMPPELHGGHGLHGVQESSFAALSFLGGFMLLLFLLLAGLTALYLWRSGRLSLPALGRPDRPEQEARRILAERFARGDITTDDFLERASTLNWTPGVEAVSHRRRRNRP